jgi:chaperone modulatory protein CbpM
MAINDDALTAWVDEAFLTLDELCRATEVGPDWVAERVQAGLLASRQSEGAAWRFDTVALQRVRCMVRLERDFDAVPELAALVADLQAEIQRLRARLARAGFD